MTAVIFDLDGTLIDSLADIAARVEIHEMKVDDKGVMTMRPLDGGVEIPPGAEVKLAPGGTHLTTAPGLRRSPAPDVP